VFCLNALFSAISQKPVHLAQGGDLDIQRLLAFAELKKLKSLKLYDLRSFLGLSDTKENLSLLIAGFSTPLVLFKLKSPFLIFHS
jgi:hypothetical protein